MQEQKHDPSEFAGFPKPVNVTKDGERGLSVKQLEREGTDKRPIRRSILSETNRNIASIAKALEEGRPVDMDLLKQLVNTMIMFLNATVKIPEEDGNVREVQNT